ncbi:MAG: DUF4347 domain-containing protein, partial [Rubripirellula sp.]
MPKRLNDWWRNWQLAADAAVCRLSRAAAYDRAHEPAARLTPLEPRLLFSATPIDPSAIAGGVEAEIAMDSSDNDSSAASINGEDNESQATEAATSVDIVVIDSSVSDIDQLLDDLGKSGRNARVIVLDSERDGIDQISQLLDVTSDVSSLHIVSHSEDGAIKLGNLWLGETNLAGYAGQIAVWQDSFHSDADILLYGCDLANSPAGLNLIESLHSLTGADVAASLDDTGHSAFGGNWQLEYKLGTVETEIAFSESVQQTWRGKLKTITVTTTADAFDSGDGLKSLREAVVEANVGSGGDTIVLASGTYVLSELGTAEDFGLSGDLDLVVDTMITGAGLSNTIIDANGIDRVFEFIGSINVSLKGLTIQGGGNAGGPGGGIYSPSATVQIADSVIQDNTATGADGGGIASGGGLTLTRVQIRNNVSSGNGGGVFNSGNLSLTDVTIDDNEALGASDGGGLYNTSGSATLERVTLSRNSAAGGLGGGIFNQGADGLSLTNVTISSNTSTQGAALYTWNQVGVTNSTVVSNIGTAGVGGIHIKSGVGSVDLKNSILAGNTGGNANEGLTSLGHNLEDGSSAFTAEIGDLQSVSSFMSTLGALQDNGGHTETHALLAGNLAIDAGSSIGAPTEDQRSVVRDSNVDMGAFEYVDSGGNNAPTDITLDNSSVAENSDGAVIGNLAVVDPDIGDSHTWSVNDARFEIVGTQLRLKAGQSLDFETEPTVNLTITTTDQSGAGLSYNEGFVIGVSGVNEAPTDITLDNSSVAENSDGAVIGNLAVVDP